MTALNGDHFEIVEYLLDSGVVIRDEDRGKRYSVLMNALGWPQTHYNEDWHRRRQRVIDKLRKQGHIIRTPQQREADKAQ